MKFLLTILTMVFGMLMGVLAMCFWVEGEALRPHLNIRFVAQLLTITSFTLILSCAYLLAQGNDKK